MAVQESVTAPASVLRAMVRVGSPEARSYRVSARDFVTQPAVASNSCSSTLSGSDGMSKQQELLVKHFEKHGATVSKQAFTAKAKSQANTMTMTNLIAKWHPEKAKRIILCAHYDTRPQADEEEERTKWNKKQAASLLGLNRTTLVEMLKRKRLGPQAA